ncbi:MAG: hypothetical protein IBJ12_14685 [Sphingomonadaceae bacterium]|nr:hypothetical protein [Sphingomonadaceae bacterium]
MEMTFPHQALRQDSVSHRFDHKAIIAVAMKRQANSRTVRALRRAEFGVPANRDQMGQRIHYFGCGNGSEAKVSGAFWSDGSAEPTCERTVYQAALVNVKDDRVDRRATGEQLNHAGHGASRKL